MKLVFSAWWNIVIIIIITVTSCNLFTFLYLYKMLYLIIISIFVIIWNWKILQSFHFIFQSILILFQMNYFRKKNHTTNESCKLCQYGESMKAPCMGCHGQLWRIRHGVWGFWHRLEFCHWKCVFHYNNDVRIA